jgi:glutaredoxin
MKKLKFLLVAALVLFIPFVAKADTKEKINVYIFRGEGCPHCEEAITWFTDTLSKDKEYSEYYNLVQYEVWYDEDNNKLMSSVAKELGTQASGVPFIVVGEKYFSGFSASESPKALKEAIKEAYNNADYKDVVELVKNGDKKEDKKTNYIPIIIVAGVAIVTVIGLIFFTKDKE